MILSLVPKFPHGDFTVDALEAGQVVVRRLGSASAISVSFPHSSLILDLNFVSGNGRSIGSSLFPRDLEVTLVGVDGGSGLRDLRRSRGSLDLVGGLREFTPSPSVAASDLVVNVSRGIELFGLNEVEPCCIFNKVNPLITGSESGNRLHSGEAAVVPEVVALNGGTSIKDVSNSKPLDRDTTFSGISLGVGVVHWGTYLLNSGSGANGNSFAGEVGPALGVLRSNTGCNVLALILLVLSTPESAHGEGAAFVFDNLFVRSIAECDVLLGDTVVASLNVDLVLGNFLLGEERVHLPADSNFPISDESSFICRKDSFLHDVSGRRLRNVRLRSGLDLESLGPSTPAEGVLGADSVEVESVVSETTMALGEVAGLEALGIEPVRSNNYYWWWCLGCWGCLGCWWGCLACWWACCYWCCWLLWGHGPASGIRSRGTAAAPAATAAGTPAAATACKATRLTILSIPLELEHGDHDAESTSLISVKVLPVDVNGVTSSVSLAEVGESHGIGAGDNHLSGDVFRRELVRSAMLVEAADHHLDKVSFNESGEAGNGAFSQLLCSSVFSIKHGDSALAIGDNRGVLSEAVVLKLNPRSVLLLEHNLVSKDGSGSGSHGLIPSDLNVGTDKLNYGSLDSVRTGGGSEGEDFGEVRLSTDVLSRDSESVLLSFFESVDGSSVLEEAGATAVLERPFDSQAGISLVPLNLELSVSVSVGPGKIKRSDGGESELLKDIHSLGLSTNSASLHVVDGNFRPSSGVLSSASKVEVGSNRELEGLELPLALRDKAGSAQLQAGGSLVALGNGVVLQVLTTGSDLVLLDDRSNRSRLFP